MFFSVSADVPDELLELRLLLPDDTPVTSAEARERGVGFPQLRALVRRGLVRRPVHGVYAVASLPDDLAFRVSVLKLMVPDSCVVTDRTAGWLWGANMILAPNDHLLTPRVSVFCPPGCRLRNELTASGERRLALRDVAEIDGLRVTTPLRTACDLGRLLHRDQAIAALDSLAALRFSRSDELLQEIARFRRYRGVIQLRVSRRLSTRSPSRPARVSFGSAGSTPVFPGRSARSRWKPTGARRTGLTSACRSFASAPSTTERSS